MNDELEEGIRDAIKDLQQQCDRCIKGAVLCKKMRLILCLLVGVSYLAACCFLFYNNASKQGYVLVACACISITGAWSFCTSMIRDHRRFKMRYSAMKKQAQDNLAEYLSKRNERGF